MTNPCLRPEAEWENAWIAVQRAPREASWLEWIARAAELWDAAQTGEPAAFGQGEDTGKPRRK